VVCGAKYEFLRQKRLNIMYEIVDTYGAYCNRYTLIRLAEIFNVIVQCNIIYIKKVWIRLHIYLNAC
jgi:hypothetical protein